MDDQGRNTEIQNWVIGQTQQRMVHTLLFPNRVLSCTHRKITTSFYGFAKVSVLGAIGGHVLRRADMAVIHTCFDTVSINTASKACVVSHKES